MRTEERVSRPRKHMKMTLVDSRNQKTRAVTRALWARGGDAGWSWRDQQLPDHRGPFAQWQNLQTFSEGNEKFCRGVTYPRYYEENGLEMAKVDEVRLGKRLLSYSRQGPLVWTRKKVIKMERSIQEYFRGQNIWWWIGVGKWKKKKKRIVKK